MCEKTIQDVVERFWDIIEEININRVLRFLKDNIVSKYNAEFKKTFVFYALSITLSVAVVVITSIFWIPVSCVISYFDRKKLRHEMKQLEWSSKLDLIHPSDRRRVIHIRCVCARAGAPRSACKSN